MNQLLGLSILTAATFTGAQQIQLSRTYKVGEIDKFHITMKLQGVVPSEIQMDTAHKVVSVFGNGDAEIETTVSGLKVIMQGQEVALPISAPSRSRVTKYGTPVNAKAGMGKSNLDLTAYLNRLPKEGMTVSQTVNFDEIDPESKAQTEGTTKLESVTEGRAKLITSLDYTTDKAKKPMHLDFTSWIEVATGIPQRMEGKATNLDVAGASGVDSVIVVMERKL